jgi:GNAT superfamily N-acetyltransferase
VLSPYTVDLTAPDDLAAIASMRALEGWAENRWLLDAVQDWPGGHIFVARPEERPELVRRQSPAAALDVGPPLLGTVSAVAYGELGFIGNMIVHPSARRRGLGVTLMRTALDWLAGVGVRRVELDATPEGRPMYERLGFVGTDFSWLLGTPVPQTAIERVAERATTQYVERLDAAAVGRVAALDRDAFGGERLGLLGTVLAMRDTRGYVAYDSGARVTGYLFVRPAEGMRAGLRVGPWVARTPGDAAGLLACALTEARRDASEVAHLHACIPGASQVALDLYTSIGFTLIRDDLRMHLELPARDVIRHRSASDLAAAAGAGSGRCDWVYAMLAPMVG